MEFHNIPIDDLSLDGRELLIATLETYCKECKDEKELEEVKTELERLKDYTASKRKDK